MSNVKRRKWPIPALILFSLCICGCYPCRKTIVFITVPAEQCCEIREEVRDLSSHGVPMNRIDSLFIEVQKASEKARIEAYDATKHLIP